MSFAFISYNEYGIVASADHRLTGTNQSGEKHTFSDSCKKLFLSPQGFVVAYTGCSSVNGSPVPAKISELWENSDSPLALSEFFSQFVVAMSTFCTDNIVFLAAGYQDGLPKILTATTTAPQIKEMGSLGYSGATDVAEKLLAAIPIIYDTMTLQDRIDFHRFITQSIAKLQFYSDRLQTVSETCDVVVIQKDGVSFSSFKKLN